MREAQRRVLEPERQISRMGVRAQVGDEHRERGGGAGTGVANRERRRYPETARRPARERGTGQQHNERDADEVFERADAVVRDERAAERERDCRKEAAQMSGRSFM